MKDHAHRQRALDPPRLARQHHNDSRGKPRKPFDDRPIPTIPPATDKPDAKTTNALLTSKAPSWMTTQPPSERRMGCGRSWGGERVHDTTAIRPPAPRWGRAEPRHARPARPQHAWDPGACRSHASAATRPRRGHRLGPAQGRQPPGDPGHRLFLARGQASYTVEVNRGATTCRGTGPSDAGSVTLFAGTRRLAAEFDATQPVPHLRCPRPSVSPLAFGTAPLGRIARHGGTIHLRGGNRLRDEGYTGRTTAKLALTMSRPKVKITTDALRSPAPG
jgi:hypothetical protein